MVRTPGYDKFGLKKGTWTPEEDKKLTAYVTKHGYRNWRKLPKHAGLSRCGKSCRLRWMNYLRPDVKRGNYSKDEEDTIIRLHNKLGNRWSVIAAQLPGRSDNEVKNHWHSYLKKRIKQNMTSNETNSNDVSSQSTTSNQTNPNDDFSPSSRNGEGEVAEANNINSQINEITFDTPISYSPQQSYSDFSETWDSFWTDPFLSETSSMLNGDFSGVAAAATEAMMYPDGLLSPPYYTDFFDGEVLYEYDDLFGSF